MKIQSNASSNLDSLKVNEVEIEITGDHETVPNAVDRVIHLATISQNSEISNHLTGLLELKRCIMTNSSDDQQSFTVYIPFLKEMIEGCLQAIKEISLAHSHLDKNLDMNHLNEDMNHLYFLADQAQFLMEALKMKK